MLGPRADETQVLQLKGVCVPEICLVMMLKAPETLKLGPIGSPKTRILRRNIYSVPKL